MMYVVTMMYGEKLRVGGSEVANLDYSYLPYKKTQQPDKDVAGRVKCAYGTVSKYGIVPSQT